MTSRKTASSSVILAVSLLVAGAALAGAPGASGEAPTRGEVLQADVIAQDCGRPTRLNLAALRGNATEIHKLLIGGANVTATDAMGNTPLHSAARRFRIKATEALIAAGAPLEARNQNGMTPLTLLASMGPGEVPEVDEAKARVAALLIDAGANVNATDASGATPLGYALARQNTRLAALLRQHAAVQGTFDPAQHHASERTAPGYPTPTDIETTLANVAATYPSIAEKVLLGNSVQGRAISAIHISDNLGVEEDEPEVSYISTMHGDEPVGTIMCLNLIDWLTSNYGSDSRATNMVDNMDIWIVPLMNPDGYYNNTRYNANGYDLNRSFPDQYDDPVNTPTGRPQEVQVIMNWRFAHSFVLSANFHTGALVVNYPWDSNPTGTSGIYSACPDDDLFIDLSLEYSEDNGPMYASATFPQGITNGTDWYVAFGGMQDWNYVYLGDNEVTIELSDGTKAPNYALMPTFWAQNQESMISYLERALTGLRGIVTDSTTGDPVYATITVTGRDHDVYTDPDVGDYHRLLLAGTYEVTFTADGYETLVAPNVVIPPGQGPATRLDVQMDPSGSVAAAEVVFPNGGESLPAGVQQILQWNGSSTASYQVQATLNYNDTATVLDGFESGAIGPDYTSGGDVPWTITTSPVFDGTYAAASGNISDGQTSWLERSANGPGYIDFWYRVSSESGYDFFRFLIDGQEVTSNSGSTTWIEVYQTFDAGPHTLRWEYSKDGSVSAGSDTAWIDALKLVTDNTTWTDVVADTGVGVLSYPWTPSTETDSAKVRVRKLLTGGILGPWDESDAVFAVVPPTTCVGDINGDLVTDVYDFGILAAHFGSNVPMGTNGDLNGDALVNVFDFGIFAGDFGCAP